MQLTLEEQDMLAGKHGKAVGKAMEILVALGTIYGAERMIPISSVQVAGVSYDNLGEAGLHFLTDLAEGGGQVCVLTTLNPAGMDMENWQSLGIPPEFAENQKRVMDAFTRMGVVTTCTCTPYLSGNLPHFGEHIAWAESSAVCFANSVLGACTNREGGPGALAAALTGRTPEYGYHLEVNRLPVLTVEVLAHLEDRGVETQSFGALGKTIGDILQQAGQQGVVYIRGIQQASLESLKSLCASIATYGGAAMFHMEGITPESYRVCVPDKKITITRTDLDRAIEALNEGESDDIDFVSLGCPHLSIHEIALLSKLLAGKTVRKEFWITTARVTKQIADRNGYTQIIEASGAKFAADTCCVVAPIKGRFTVMATDSAKACYYATTKNQFKTVFKSFYEVVAQALK